MTESQLHGIIKESIEKVLYESKDIETINYLGDTLSVKNYYLSDEADSEFINVNKEVIWSILQSAYENIGGFKGYQSIRDMMRKSPIITLGFQNGEIVTVSVYNDYADGNKCVGMGCVKDDRHKNAVMLLELIIKYNIKNWNEWYWIEASGKIEEMFRSFGGFNVPSKYAGSYLYNGDMLEQVDDYHYKRNVMGNEVVKTIFGFKSGDVFEHIKSELDRDVEDFIKTVNNCNVSESSSEIEAEFAKFMAKQPEIEKHRAIVNHFVYLKYDMLVNEFTINSLNKLKTSIKFIEDALKSGDYDKSKERQYEMTVEEGYNVINTSTVLEPLKLTA